MTSRTRHIALSLVALIVALGVAWWVQNKPSGASGKTDAVSTAMPGGPGAPGGSKAGPGAGGAPGKGGPGGPPGVEVGRAEKVRLEDDSQAVGTLRSLQGVVVRPEVSGRIQQIAFTDGQRVRKGQLMFQLDDTLQVAQLKQAEAAAAIARTNLQRSRELAAQNFVSQSAVDQNGAALDVAMAQVALASAQLVRMKIHAPFDGVVGIRNVNVGDYVKDGADLVQLEDLSSLWVDFRLPERYLSKIRPGQLVELSLDALPGRAFKARVEALDAQLDANGRSVLVRARLANADGVLKGGMFARVRTVFAVRDQAIMVPEESLVPQGERQFVFKVIDNPEGGKLAQKVAVKVGVRVPGKAEITDGLADGDVVVVAGQARLTRGDRMPVRVVDLNRPPSGGESPSKKGEGKGAPAGGAAPKGEPAAKADKGSKA